MEQSAVGVKADATCCNRKNHSTGSDFSDAKDLILSYIVHTKYVIRVVKVGSLSVLKI